MWRSLVAALCLCLLPCMAGVSYGAIDGYVVSPRVELKNSVSSIVASNARTAVTSEWGLVQKTPPFVRFIALLLFAMGASVVVVGLKQLVRLTRERRYLETLERECVPALQGGRVINAMHAASRDSDNAFGQSLARAIRTLCLESEGHLEPMNVELARSGLRRERASHAVEVGRGLTMLASITTTASLLGLLATTIGIINAMQGVSTNEGTGIGAFAGGMSEAFILIAAGLIISLVSVWVRGYLASRADEIRLKLESITTSFEVYCVAREDRAVQPFNVFEATSREPARRSPGVLGVWR
jgi:biopolymer transport protein ExbB/TolQ